MRKIGINLVFEDELHAAVLEKILTASRKYSIGAWVQYGGSAEIRKKIKSYNYSARGMAYLVLTDLDQSECAPGLIEEWLKGHPRHPNLLFRVAVRQVEAWLLASRREFAHFAKVKEHLIPERPDDLENSKKSLIQLVDGSEDADLRTDIVPDRGSTAKVGPDYNGRLRLFVQTYWNLNVAKQRSPSLRRAVQALKVFMPVWSQGQPYN
jgi:hypothetical protein